MPVDVPVIRIDGRVAVPRLSIAVTSAQARDGTT
jgi:hypothetical protein